MNKAATEMRMKLDLPTAFHSSFHLCDGLSIRAAQQSDGRLSRLTSKNDCFATIFSSPRWTKQQKIAFLLWSSHFPPHSFGPMSIGFLPCTSRQSDFVRISSAGLRCAINLIFGLLLSPKSAIYFRSHFFVSPIVIIINIRIIGSGQRYDFLSISFCLVWTFRLSHICSLVDVFFPVFRSIGHVMIQLFLIVFCEFGFFPLCFRP